MSVNGKKLVTAVPLCSSILQLLATYYRRALNLVPDFDFIESGVSADAPKYME
jgi:uncharacterized YccA/Bax inhibitor family protein